PGAGPAPRLPVGVDRRGCRRREGHDQDRRHPSRHRPPGLSTSPASSHRAPRTTTILPRLHAFRSSRLAQGSGSAVVLGALGGSMGEPTGLVSLRAGWRLLCYTAGGGSAAAVKTGSDSQGISAGLPSLRIWPRLRGFVRIVGACYGYADESIAPRTVRGQKEAPHGVQVVRGWSVLCHNLREPAGVLRAVRHRGVRRGGHRPVLGRVAWLRLRGDVHGGGGPGCDQAAGRSAFRGPPAQGERVEAAGLGFPDRGAGRWRGTRSSGS